MCENIKISAQAGAHLLLKELVLEGLLARIGAGALEALLVLAVVLGHLPHLYKGKGHFRSKQLWFLSKIEQGVKFTWS